MPKESTTIARVTIGLLGAAVLVGLLAAQTPEPEPKVIHCAAEVAFIADLISVTQYMEPQFEQIEEVEAAYFQDLPEDLRQYFEDEDGLTEADRMAGFALVLHDANFAAGERMGRCLSTHYFDAEQYEAEP